MSMAPHFRIPLNLAHAATVAKRLIYHLERLQKLRQIRLDQALDLAVKVAEQLSPFQFSNEHHESDQARAVVAETARLAREMVDEIEQKNAGDDRLGQAVRNLFECLEMGEEGARISLRAGENPDSALRPQ